MSDLHVFTKQQPLVLVGCGNMGAALVRGWVRGGLAPSSLVIIDPALTPDQLPDVADAVIVPSINAMPAGVAARALVLAVKPQSINDILPGLRSVVDANTVAISVAAGVTLAQLRRGLGDIPDIVRTIPNTPAAVGAGATGMVAADGTTQASLSLAQALMMAAGLVVTLDDEKLIDAVTAVSGSGPAYVFYMVEALSAAGQTVGLSPRQAEELARQTIIGAAKLMEADAGVSAATLRTRVTSPNGTTAAALDVLMTEGDGLRDLMTRAVQAGKKRSKELAG